MRAEIILIGPIACGKTTVAELISMRTGLPRRSMDELRWHYYEEIGYDWGVAREYHRQAGFWGLYRYWKPFEAYAVQRLLEDFEECIFDFGGSHSVYEDDELFEQVRQALLPYPFVILLLPSPDLDESIRILNERTAYIWDDQNGDKRNVNEHFVRHHSNYDLAKRIVYTKGKEPDEVCEEIIEWVKSESRLLKKQTADIST